MLQPHYIRITTELRLCIIKSPGGNLSFDAFIPWSVRVLNHPAE